MILFALASIEIAEPGKIICLTGREGLSAYAVNYFESQGLGNAIIIDRDVIGKLSEREQINFLKMQVDCHFSEWSDHPDFDRAIECVLSGMHQLSILQKMGSGDRRNVLPFLVYESGLFGNFASAMSNNPAPEILKKLMRNHETSHLSAFLKGDSSHSLFSSASDQETYADLSALRHYGYENREDISSGLEALVCWRAYRYLFKRTPDSDYYPCGYITNLERIREVLTADDPIQVDQSFEKLHNLVRGIDHVVLTWLYFNGPDNPVVSKYRMYADSQEAASYLFMHPEMKMLALAGIAERILTGSPLDDHDQLLDEQKKLIQYGLIGYSLFDGQSALLDKEVLRNIRLDTEHDFRVAASTGTLAPKQTTRIRKSQVIQVLIPD